VQRPAYDGPGARAHSSGWGPAVSKDPVGPTNANSASWHGRVEDYARHVTDLRQRGYEGALDRDAKEVAFVRAFEVTTPLALQVLDDLSDWYLCGTGTTSTDNPRRDESGGLKGCWSLSWPLLETDRDRMTGEELPPVRLRAIFPIDWTHPHLALIGPHEDVFAWPFQVVSYGDATRQEAVLRVIAEAEMHDRIYCAVSNWAVLPEGFAKTTS
jgi:hypothetical protein